MSETATRTYGAVQAMAAELPQLVGEADWPAVARQLAQLDAAWATADAARQIGLAARYRSLLAPYPAARERLRRALDDAALYGDALLGVAAVAEALGDGAGAAALRTAAGEASQSRLIFEQGIGREAYSLKLANLDFKFWNLAAAAGGVVSAVGTLNEPVRPFGLAAAVLLLIAGAGRLLVREIGVDDTSVFLGLLAAAGETKRAGLPAIMAATNDARAGVYLPALTEEQVKRALLVLHQLRSISPGDCADEWRVVEEHGRV